MGDEKVKRERVVKNLMVCCWRGSVSWKSFEFVEKKKETGGGRERGERPHIYLTMSCRHTLLVNVGRNQTSNPWSFKYKDTSLVIHIKSRPC